VALNPGSPPLGDRVQVAPRPAAKPDPGRLHPPAVTITVGGETADLTADELRLFASALKGMAADRALPSSK